MKKRFGLIVSSLLLFVLAACGSNVDGATADKYIDKGKMVVENLNAENYEDIYAQFDSAMKDSLSTEQMAELAPIIEASGKFEKISKESIEEKDGNYIVVLVAEYSEENRAYTISFNNSEEIIGLFVK